VNPLSELVLEPGPVLKQVEQKCCWYDDEYIENYVEQLGEFLAAHEANTAVPDLVCEAVETAQ
jgi:hypothetical protein